MAVIPHSEASYDESCFGFGSEKSGDISCCNHQLEQGGLMVSSRHRTQLIWIVIAYIALVGLILCPAVHEGFNARIVLWNCLPPTFGLFVVASSLGKATRRLIVSATFAIVSAAVTAFFVAVWIFTPLDTNPHSGTTVLVFAFAPLWSVGIATVATLAVWFMIPTNSP